MMENDGALIWIIFIAGVSCGVLLAAMYALCYALFVAKVQP